MAGRVASSAGRGRKSQGSRVKTSGSVTATAQAQDAKAPALPMMRTSERNTFKTCEFQWYISYELRSRLGTPAPALRFGTLIHRALADWYIKGTKRGKNPVKTFERYYDEDVRENEASFGWKLSADEPWQEARDIGVGMLTHYLEVYGNDSDWDVLATEHPFKQVVSHPETGEPWFMYTGIVDGVWRDKRDNSIWVADHKTTASLSDSKLSYLQMDDQAGAYWSWGVDYLAQNGFIKNTSGLTGMMYNFMRKGLPDERPSRWVNGKLLYLNKDGSISKVQPPPLFKRFPIWRDEADRAMTKRRSMDDYGRIEMVRNGELTLTKHPGMMTCPGCPARDACELHETGNDWEGFLAHAGYKWEPYAEHEIYGGDTK